KVKDTTNKLNRIPTDIIEKAFSYILYIARTEEGYQTIPESHYHTLLMKCYNKLDPSTSYLKQILDLDDFVKMISHFEILILWDDGLYSTPHPILSDYLISKLFAENWRDYSNEWLVNSFHDVWLYASS